MTHIGMHHTDAEYTNAANNFQWYTEDEAIVKAKVVKEVGAGGGRSFEFISLWCWTM